MKQQQQKNTSHMLIGELSTDWVFDVKELFISFHMCYIIEIIFQNVFIIFL